jgi:hypothetical protein
VKLVAEYLLRMMFPETKTNWYLTGEENLFNHKKVIDFLSTNLRVPTQLSTDSKTTQEFLDLLKFHLPNTKTRRIRVTNPKFYEDMPIAHKIAVTREEIHFFSGGVLDLAILLGILLYLGAISFIIGSKPSKVKQD